jgi:hypothetical protein
MIILCEVYLLSSSSSATVEQLDQVKGGGQEKILSNTGSLIQQILKGIQTECDSPTYRNVDS